MLGLRADESRLLDDGIRRDVAGPAYEVWPEDHVGDQVLAEGRRTFAIEVTQDGLASVLIDE